MFYPVLLLTSSGIALFFYKICSSSVSFHLPLWSYTYVSDLLKQTLTFISNEAARSIITQNSETYIDLCIALTDIDVTDHTQNHTIGID